MAQIHSNASNANSRSTPEGENTKALALSSVEGIFEYFRENKTIQRKQRTKTRGLSLKVYLQFSSPFLPFNPFPLPLSRCTLESGLQVEQSTTHWLMQQLLVDIFFFPYQRKKEREKILFKKLFIRLVNNSKSKKCFSSLFPIFKFIIHYNNNNYLLLY